MDFCIDYPSVGRGFAPMSDARNFIANTLALIGAIGRSPLHPPPRETIHSHSHFVSPFFVLFSSFSFLFLLPRLVNALSLSVSLEIFDGARRRRGDREIKRSLYSSREDELEQGAVASSTLR